MTGAERWLPARGWEGLYEVSDHGRVRSLDRFDSWGRRRVGQMRKVQLQRYSNVMLTDGARRRLVQVHTLVLETFVGPRPPGTEGCHGDGDPHNNHVSNLRWDTHSANVLDTVAHGRSVQRNRTHCPRSHPLAGANIRPNRHGYRTCWACARGRDWARYRGVPMTQAIGDRFFAEITANEGSSG